MKKTKNKNLLSWAKHNPISTAIFTIALGMFVWYMYPYFTPVIEMEPASINQIGTDPIQPKNDADCGRRASLVCSRQTLVKNVGGYRRLVRERNCRCIAKPTNPTNTSSNEPKPKIECGPGTEFNNGQCVKPIPAVPNPGYNQ